MRLIAGRLLLSLATVFAFCSVVEWCHAEGDWVFEGGLRINTHFRHSEENEFAVPASPGGPLKTVQPGNQWELSVLSLHGDAFYGDHLQFHVKVDIHDKYDRNPTSGDKDIDVDSFWIRYGQEARAWQMPDDRGAYVKAGKIGKFERQTDRHLQSYGLLSTTFNRFEDLGVELGVDFTPNLYMKASLTSGNPLFIRDPNALAGDHGTSDLFTGRQELAQGIPTLYDAEVEDFQWDDNFTETGLGLGFRLGEAGRLLNVMVFGYERQLKEEANLFGTHYGGDLDILSGPGSVITDLDGDRKTEYGANIWLYYDNWTLFGQYVQSDVGGLERWGAEAELSYRIDLPETVTIGETPLFTSISPAFRVSHLNPDFEGPANYPVPSLFWDWTKYDFGARINVLPGLELTVEYTVSEFTRGNGSEDDNNEFLTSLSFSRSF